MRPISILAVAAVLALASCGDDDDSSAASPAADSAMENESPAPKAEASAPAKRGTKIHLAGSEYGSMLFGPNRQAIYIFQNDSQDRSACYGECAVAWPPVFTKGKPRAGKGVKESLLGTTKRRGGRRQVTYAGQPLYYYVNEGPGEVRCHNVNLNGGLWWVVGPDGKRRA